MLVFIQGAGLGGLTLAIALQKRGYRVRVIERAAALLEVGAGIWMTLTKSGPMVSSRLTDAKLQ